MFSKSCEYGIKAIIYIALQSLQGDRVKIGAIAQSINSPVAFTAKILGALVKFDIVHSHTGPNGGFYIDPTRMQHIKMSEIVAAIDGDKIYNGCALGLSECSSTEPCPMHNKFVVVRDGLKHMLTHTTVYELALGMKDGQTTLYRA